MKKLSSPYYQRTAIRVTKNLFLRVSADGAKSPRFSSAKEPQKRIPSSLFPFIEISEVQKKCLANAFALSVMSRPLPVLDGLDLTLEKQKKDIFFGHLDLIEQDLKKHPATDHPFFDYLEQSSKQGFNKMQFAMFCVNFIVRTRTTAPVVASTLARAILEGDFESASLIYKNLEDEIGGGNPSKAHPKMLLECFNRHAKKVFGLEGFTSDEVEKSPMVLEQTKEFREMKLKMFANMASYANIAGNLWAHELCADNMLEDFRKTFFDSYKTSYNSKEWQELMEFFNAHHNEHGDDLVEQRHQQDARVSLYYACRGDISKLEEVKAGAINFLDCQANLWSSLMKAMQSLENVGDKVLPNKFKEVEIDESVYSEKSNQGIFLRDCPTVLKSPQKAQPSSLIA